MFGQDPVDSLANVLRDWDLGAFGQGLEHHRLVGLQIDGGGDFSAPHAGWESNMPTLTRFWGEGMLPQIPCCTA